MALLGAMSGTPRLMATHIYARWSAASGKATEMFVFRNGKWGTNGWQPAPDRAQP